MGGSVYLGRQRPRSRLAHFPLRRGLTITVELPSDLKLSDLRRFVWYLVTMCNDWEVEMGLPVLAFSENKER